MPKILNPKSKKQKKTLPHSQKVVDRYTTKPSCLNGTIRKPSNGKENYSNLTLSEKKLLLQKLFLEIRDFKFKTAEEFHTKTKEYLKIKEHINKLNGFSGPQTVGEYYELMMLTK